SLTGGLVCAELTDVPGASAVLREGFVVYSEAAKMRALGVDERTLREHGAVSEPVARALASGARARAGTTWGLGVTGIAGPDGGPAEKPVGLVAFAVADAREVPHTSRVLPGDRDTIRRLSAAALLDLLRRRLV